MTFGFRNRKLINLVEFGYKEEYMRVVNPWILLKKQEMKDFLKRELNPEKGNVVKLRKKFLERS